MRRSMPEENPNPPSRRPPSWASYALVGWVLLYLGIHLHAAITMNPWPLPQTPDALRDDATGRIVELGVCLVLVGAILTALALVRPWGRLLPRWMVLGIAWVGAAVGILHWAIWTVKGLRRVFGLVPLEMEPGVSRAEMVAYADRYDLVNLTFNEPWFLIVGVLFAVAALQYRRRERARPAGEVAAPPSWMVRPAVGLVTVGWAVTTAVLHLSWAAGSTWGQRLGLGEPDNQEDFLAHLRGWFLVVGLLCLLTVPLALVLTRPFGQRYSNRVVVRPAQVLSAFFLLGGLFIVLIGVMSFNAWIFAYYGPLLMAGGILLELSVWHHRLRPAPERAESPPARVAI
jgi:hypothetical protein